MKQLSIEEKAKTYDELFVKAKQIYNKENDVLIIHTIEDLFPELKESEGERIRKVLLNDFKNNCSEYYCEGVTRDMIIAWLEKQRDYNRLIEEMRERKELFSKEKEKATSANDKLSLGGRIAMLQELLAFNTCNTTDKIEPK